MVEIEFQSVHCSFHRVQRGSSEKPLYKWAPKAKMCTPTYNKLKNFLKIALFFGNGSEGSAIFLRYGTFNGSDRRIRQP